jgi:hypothetical protein
VWQDRVLSTADCEGETAGERDMDFAIAQISQTAVFESGEVLIC